MRGFSGKTRTKQLQEGLAGWPAKPFGMAMKCPQDFREALQKAMSSQFLRRAAVDQVHRECGDIQQPGSSGDGRRRPRCCQKPFAEALKRLSELLPDAPAFQAALSRLGELADPDSLSYDLHCLSEYAMNQFEMDEVFGTNKDEVMYDSWVAKQDEAKRAAICGGVFLQMSPFMWPRFNAYMNPKGRCFSFDQAANGYVRGECCASAALKPYAEKVDNQLIIADGPCLGTLVGWRMTNNGRSAGLAAPSGPAEQEAIADCVKHAGISPLDVDAMESTPTTLSGVSVEWD
ncbi:ppsD [Symbiodinium pilosum]|uniref:PpsD protein n=1 Tax=Symbiodinium pilosum TaxID=2952 RepID=A0A812K5Q9_SYMPI|nr:ppsD [Symbiodinium pilosum]